MAFWASSKTPKLLDTVIVSAIHNLHFAPCQIQARSRFGTCHRYVQDFSTTLLALRAQKGFRCNLRTTFGNLRVP